MEITRETSPASSLKHGHTAVGQTAVPLVATDFAQFFGVATYRGILVRAAGAGEDSPNSDIVYVGAAGVTADNSVSGGFPLLPGASLILPVDNPNKIYAISPSGTQDLAWICI